MSSNPEFIVGTMRLGSWGAQMDTAQLRAFIESCLELGLDSFDLADIYGDYSTEADFGLVLKDGPSLKSQVKLITKCGIKMISGRRPEHKLKSYDSSAAHIRSSVENSLRMLDVNQLDVLLLHRPDYLMNPHEVAEVFSQLKEEGKVAEFGVSNFSCSQFDTLHRIFPLLTNQIQISIAHMTALDDGTLDQALSYGLRPMAWSPLGGGADLSANSQLQIALSEIAKSRHIDNAQVYLAWLKSHPANVIPILGTTKIERISKACESSSVRLSREEWYSLLEAARGHKLP